MPGNIANASPILIFPQTLCTSFSESRAYETLSNTYSDGTLEQGQLSASSRRVFKQSKRLTNAQASILFTFIGLVDGGLTPFFYYNPFEGSPIGSNYDPTGTSVIGKYIVRFQSQWSIITESIRSTIPNLEMVEIQ